MDEAICIWCGTAEATSFEHILPEALGCPPDFVLRAGVCSKCNNENGALDRAILKPFEIITVLRGIPRKRGKRPTVDSFSTFSSGYDESGVVLYINRERHSIVTPTGKRLGPTSKADDFESFAFERSEDGQARISYNQRLAFDRKAVRGLFKIAIEAVAYFEGTQAARAPEFDAARKFVRRGKGAFRALLIGEEQPSFEHYFAPSFRKEGSCPCVGMTIFGLGFVCDFDPEFRGGSQIENAARAEGLRVHRLPN